MTTKKKYSFDEALNIIKREINSKDINEELLKSLNFPPRYLFDMYLMNNPYLIKTVNRYINKDYNMFYKLNCCDAVEIIREYKFKYGLYDPSYPKKKTKDIFKEDLKNLKEKHINGLGKPELEIFISKLKELPLEKQTYYFKTTKAKIKKMAKGNKEDLKDLHTRETTHKNLKPKIQALNTNVGFSFLNKTGNCLNCKHVNQSIAINTNAKPGEPVDILILSEMPIGSNVMSPDGMNLLNNFMSHYNLNNVKYLHTNIVLCDNGSKIDSDSIKKCHDKVEDIINEVSPRLIFAMGSKVCKRLGMSGTGIINECGSIVDYKGTPVIISLHPNYILKNSSQETYNIFALGFKEMKDILMPSNIQDVTDSKGLKPGDVIVDGEIFAAKPLPDKFYDPEWILINTFADGFKGVEHIFRNIKTNEKVVRRVSSQEYEYYYLMKNLKGVSKPTLSANDVLCKKGPWKFTQDKHAIENLGRSVMYEGNVQIATKALIDYNYHTKTELTYLPQVFRYDIEHDMSNFHGTDLSAPYKITYISAEYNDIYYVWILESENLNIDELSEYKTDSGEMRPLHINEFAGDESLMLQHFWYILLKTCDPDIMVGWNSDAFDYEYLINRSNRLPYKRNPDLLFANFSKSNMVIDMFRELKRKYHVCKEGEWGNHEITGIIVADLMKLFEAQTQNGLEQSNLNFVSEKILKKGKKPFPKRDASRDEWIEYNLWDTELLTLIDKKQQVTNFQFFLMKIAHNTWHASMYAIGIVEGLLLNHHKKKNRVVRTYKDTTIFHDIFLTTCIGGFTQTNNGGLIRMLVDMDAKSMYPSIMNTFNIGPNTLRLSVEYLVARKLMLNEFDSDEVCEVATSELSCQCGKQVELKTMKISEVYKIIKENNYIITPSGAIYCSLEEEKSIFFDLLAGLLSERDSTKKTMYDENGVLDMAKYNKQLALKISANAFYGVYLFKKFMFYNTTIGNSITMTGRFFIKSLMIMIDRFYKYNDMTTHDIVKSIDMMKQCDLTNLHMAIYADTDGCAITYQDMIPETLPIEKQIEMAEKYIADLKVGLLKDVDSLYPFFNKNDSHRLMFFKEDWIADLGLFYKDKHKRYAIHLLREGGKPKDELLFRGIQIRRSDSPKLIKDKLSQILDILLRSHDVPIHEIFDTINNIEEELQLLCKEGSMKVGSPVKFGKMIKTYKKVPYQIKSMMLWNAIHKREDFRVSDKGFYYLIQNIDWRMIQNKFGHTDDEIENIKKEWGTKAIVVPQEEEKVPEYFDVDAKAMVNKIFTIPYTNILEPIIDKTVTTDESILDFL